MVVLSPVKQDPVAWGYVGGIANGMKNKEKTHCPKGHAYAGNNLYVYNNQRRCKACYKVGKQQFLERQRLGIPLVRSRNDGVRMYRIEELTISLYYHVPPLGWRRAGMGYFTASPEVKKLDFRVTGSKWGVKAPRWEVRSIQPMQNFEIIGEVAMTQFCKAIKDLISEKVELPVIGCAPSRILPPKSL